MNAKPPRACRALIAAAGCLVPRSGRGDWRRRWDRDVWNWWAFYSEHGAFDRHARSELVRHCWGAFPDALATRYEFGPRLARFLRGPWFCLLAASLPLILAAVFSGFSGLRAILTPLPWREPDRVALLVFSAPLRIQNLSPLSIAAWRKAVRLEDLAAFQFTPVKLDGHTVRGAQVEPNFFTLLGVKPAMGRLPDPGDTNSAVLSYRAWKRIAPAHDVVLDGRRVKIAGVLPPEFWFFHRDTAVWRMLPSPPQNARLGAAIRLKPYAGGYDVERELTAISWELPERQGIWVQVLSIADRMRSARRWCGGLACAGFAVACILALAGCRRSLRGALLMAGSSGLLIAGLFLIAIELPAAVYGAGTAGHGLLVEVWYLIALPGVIWRAWRDSRRRCPTCLDRLTLPVHFGNLGSALLERTGTELVCERGHGSLYVPGMHWSTSEPERWTQLDASWQDLFRGR